MFHQEECFRTGYMDDVLYDFDVIIERAERQLAGVEFDTFVGTGFSGAVVIPTLALWMNKSYVLIRKEDDDSHHGKGALFGRLGKQWIFVDDFVSTGATRRRVIRKVAEACEKRDWKTRYLGDYTYVPKLTAPWEPERSGWEPVVYTCPNEGLASYYAAYDRP